MVSESWETEQYTRFAAFSYRVESILKKDPRANGITKCETGPIASKHGDR